MRILRASDRALLVEAADLDEAMRLNLSWTGLPGIVELVPGARTVLVRFDPARTSAAALAGVLSATKADTEHTPHTREITVPVRYDGEDLDEAAGLLGVSAEELVNRHLAAEWQVAFAGFAPGFAYVVSSDPLFDMPRRSSPRTRVPTGSVALAGQFTGVYPRESPGGWQIIGRTDAVMWDIDRDPPALLTPGTRVRFERVAERGESPHGNSPPRESPPRESPPRESPPRESPPRESPQGNPPRGDSPHGDSPHGDSPHGSLSERSETKRVERASASRNAESKRPTIEILQPSLQLLIQDAGRPGHAALGVSESGAADRTAMRDANRAVGNDSAAAVLESVGGAHLRFHGRGVAVVTGALGELTLTYSEGRARIITHGTPFATADGDELQFEHPTHGLRYVIGVRGGLAAASALGSRASDTLAGLGPDPLSAGDVVAIGAAPLRAVDPVARPRELPASGDLVELQITLGPRDDWFTASALETLTTQEWLVTPQADRVGIRLHGDVPLQRTIADELPSEGAVTGAIQVPADGQPVLFLPDHPLTGGYPIIGALTDRCLDLAGQLPPGVRVRFRIA